MSEGMSDHIDELIRDTLTPKDKPPPTDAFRAVTEAADMAGYRRGCHDDIEANERGIELAVLATLRSVRDALRECMFAIDRDDYGTMMVVGEMAIEGMFGPGGQFEVKE